MDNRLFLGSHGSGNLLTWNESTTMDNILKHGMAYEVSRLELHSTTLFISEQNIPTNNMIKEYIANDVYL
jgi:hypothetical protein